MMDFSRGERVEVLNQDCVPVGEAIVNYYNVKEKKYSVQFQYPLTGESEEIVLPEWRLRKKKGLSGPKK